MSEPTKIGDTVYIFDINRRIYERDGKGRSKGGPIYREHFTPYIIKGEDKRSWLVSAPASDYIHRIAKTHFKTAAEVDDDCWQNDHRVTVANMVLHCRDAVKLRAVAEIMGYVPHSKTAAPKDGC